jgi:hypothetical protein
MPLLNQRCSLRWCGGGPAESNPYCLQNTLLHAALLTIFHGFWAVWLLLLAHACQSMAGKEAVSCRAFAGHCTSR